MDRAPLVVLGPTAIGKSALAVTLAERADAEIVSLDAFAVYRGMDLGTAKPSVAQRRQVPHHLIDVVEPSASSSLPEFVAAAESAVADVEGRGRPVIGVGGTGLYVHALVDGYTIPPQFPEVRAELDADPDTRALWQRLHDLDPVAADRMEPSNRRRIVRALEVTLGAGRPFSDFGPGVSAFPPTRWVLIGLRLDRDRLDRRIDARFDAMMAAGLADEVAALADRIGPTAGQALGYRELLAAHRGACTVDEAVEEAKRRTRRFARRQERWFRRDPRIVWLEADADDLEDHAWAAWGKGPRSPGSEMRD